MKNSLKQLLHTPARTALFFLLMTAATLLLVFSASLWSETDQRIDQVESTFTTIGTVEQLPVLTGSLTTWENGCVIEQSSTRDIWDVRVSVDDLLFEGADYVTEPEFRPYHMVEQPSWKHTVAIEHWNEAWYHVFEFTALEDSDELGEARVQIEQVLLKQEHNLYDWGYVPPHEGEVIIFCQCGGNRFTPNGSVFPLKKGKRYIAAALVNAGCVVHVVPEEELSEWERDKYKFDRTEYAMYQAPYSTQHDAEGNEIESDWFPYLENGEQNVYRVEEVTDDFYEEGERGQNWLRWAKTINQYHNYFPVLPVDKLHMLPLFQEHRAYLTTGRAITQEEYDSGALVCMVPESTLKLNGWKIGDKLSLPLLCSLYGPDARMIWVNWTPTYGRHFYTPYEYFSPIGADGREYEAFWEAEYEIVGTYDMLQKMSVYTDGEIYPDTILIPQNSIQASDENNIAGFNYFDGKTATFQIENGTIDEFDAALRANVPQAESLLITYNDNGYTEIMETLQSTRSAAQLLFAVGLLAAIAIILLLLYFFVVKEKKRTAIEQSLGMTKSQCRVSMLAGVLVLTVLASCLGTLGGAAAMEVFHRQEQAAAEAASEDNLAEESNLEEIAETDDGKEDAAEDVILDPGEYNPKYSPWAQNANARQNVNFAARTPVFVYVLVPLALVLLVFVLSLLLVNRNLKIDPIYLLSSKSE